MATRKSGLRSLEGSVDPRACVCRGVMPLYRQFLSTTIYRFKDQGGEECSDWLAYLTRSPVSSAGRASDLQAEGPGPWKHPKPPHPHSKYPEVVFVIVSILEEHI